MTATETVEQAAPAPVDGDTRPVGHWVCCDTDLTLCGLIAADPEATDNDPDPDCVVCDDLARAGCCPLGCPCPLGPLP